MATTSAAMMRLDEGPQQRRRSRLAEGGPMTETWYDRADLVLEGGGVKGIAHVGALHAIHDRGVTVYPRVAGTSAGSIVGALVAAGLPPARMLEIMQELDYRKVRDRAGVDRVPLIGKGLSLVFEDGIYEGNYIREFLGNVLADAGVQTFADLRIDGPEGDGLPPGRRYRLVGMAIDMSRRLG